MGNQASSPSTSLLSEDVKAILKKHMTEGFTYDTLTLSSRGINDSMIPEICKWLSKLDGRVKILGLGCNRITSDGASMLFGTLKNNHSSIKQIYLNDNTNIDDNCMKSLGEYIKSNNNIDTILLGSKNISDTGIEILVPYFDGNTTFKELHLGNNQGITDNSIPLLMKMIESSCIESIGVNQTSITQKNIIYNLSVCNRIKNGSTSLHLSGSDISDDDLIQICNAVKRYGIDKLKTINLENNKLTSKGASVLLDTLKECNSVVSNLYLSYNQLDDGCMKQLGEYLQDNEHIEYLRLDNNRMAAKVVEILSEYLIGNTTLKELNLSGNEGITDTSVPHLIEMVNKSYISNLYLYRTSVSGTNQKELEEVLSIPIDQREVPIKSNTKSAAKIQSSSA